MDKGEQKFNELLEVLENDREEAFQRLVEANGGIEKVGKEPEVKLAKEGHFLVFFKGIKFPMKGFAKKEELHKLGALKRIILMGLNLGYKHIKSTIPNDISVYSPSVKELHRVLTLMAERENDEHMEQRWLKIRDIVCVILEKDLAYRYRFQDIANEVDTSKMKPDKGDWYWMHRRTDYDFGGNNPKWWPRVLGKKERS